MSSFIVNKFSKANDHNDDLLKFEFCRWIFTSEQSGVADCELVKKYTGGDSLNPRGCGSKTGRSFYAEAMLFTMSNGPLKFDKQDDALMKRLKPFFWKNEFKDSNDEAVAILNTDEACDALDCILQDGYNLFKKEGFLKIESLETLKNDIRGDSDTFDDIFEKRFELVPDKKLDKNCWMKTSVVYAVFSELNESEFNIKHKLLMMGLECKQERGPLGKGMYFKGIIHRPIPKKDKVNIVEVPEDQIPDDLSEDQTLDDN
jgi:hypothetical protein